MYRRVVHLPPLNSAVHRKALHKVYSLELRFGFTFPLHPLKYSRAKCIPVTPLENLCFPLQVFIKIEKNNSLRSCVRVDLSVYFSLVYLVC